MAKLPSGWIFVPRMRMKDKKIMIELEERKLVTCKECKHYNNKGCSEGFGWCKRNGNRHGSSDDWFCADGEAKEDE